jgi:cytochrome c556
MRVLNVTEQKFGSGVDEHRAHDRPTFNAERHAHNARHANCKACHVRHGGFVL